MFLYVQLYSIYFLFVVKNCINVDNDIQWFEILRFDISLKNFDDYYKIFILFVYICWLYVKNKE